MSDPTRPSAPKTFKVYVPEEAGKVVERVEAACRRQGLQHERKFTTSEWIMQAITEKLERDVIPTTLRGPFPSLTLDRIPTMLVWVNPGVGFGTSSSIEAADRQATEMMRARSSGAQLCSMEASVSYEDARWLVTNGARQTDDHWAVTDAARSHAEVTLGVPMRRASRVPPRVTKRAK